MKLFRLLVLAIFAAFLNPATASALPIRSTIFVVQGTDNASPPNFTNFQNWMKAYKNLGINTVQLVTWIPVDPITGLIEPAYYHSPYHDHKVTPEYMAAFTDAAHSMGLQVAWKPVFVVDDNTNNTVSDYALGPQFYPKGNNFNVKTFLSEVKSFWGKWAPVAQQYKVEMLIIGTEHGSYASSPYTQDWRDIIAITRSSFTGQLTYGENHFEPVPWAPNIEFWDALDFIGIDLYESLGNGTASTSYAEAYKNMFENNLFLNSSQGTFSLPSIMYALHKKYNKPLFITEYGIPSADGAMNHPQNGTSANDQVNYAEQANHFKANLDVWFNYDWFYGINFWNQASERTPGPSDPAFPATFQQYMTYGYEFYGKPAADIVKNYFVNQAAPPPIPLSERTNCAFDWLERKYPDLLSPLGPPSQTYAAYYYRQYSRTGAYLIFSSDNNHVYYLSTASGNSMLDIGPASDWITASGCP